MKNLIESEMDALVESKLYPSRDELIKDAFRALLRAKPNLKIESAITLYINGEISFSRAAELAGLCDEDLKNILADRGIDRDIFPSSKKAYNKARNFISSKQ